jgi:hypothetical protein
MPVNCDAIEPGLAKAIMQAPTRVQRWLLASVHKSLRLCDLCKELGFDCSDAHTVCEGWFGKLRPTLVWCSCAR